MIILKLLNVMGIDAQKVIEFYNGYFGESVDHISQIRLVSFNGEELVDFLEEFSRAHFSHSVAKVMASDSYGNYVICTNCGKGYYEK